MNYNRKIMRLELSAEKALNGGYYYAELLLPATDYEIKDAKIIQNATRRNRLKSGGNDVNETIEAEGNLQDVIELLANLRKNKEPLLHVSVFIELKARSMEKLKELQSDIAMELTRSKISVDRLTLRQK